MQVITTHINSDFDSLASMIAARRLYPDAKLVFPGSFEINLRLLLKMPEYQVSYLKVRDIFLEEIDLLVVVDTKLANRIGELARILDRKDLQIHIYDHHPSQAKDIHGSMEIIKPYGSTTTIFTQIFREKGIFVSPKEATLMALGIYEDTGFLTFPSTTPEDFQAAAYVLSCGADLSIIFNMINRDLTIEQISLLNQLLQSLEHHTINGIEVMIASVTVDQHIGDIAVLAHKIREMEKIDVLFMIVQIENRIHLVARSRVPDVDVGEITHFWGGGGHHHAASATIRGQPLPQFKESLLEVLHQRIKPFITAKDIMNSPIKSMPEIITIDKGKQLFDRYNVNTMPVLDQEGKLAGLIGRQTIDKAIRHGMKESLIRDFMQSDLITIDEETGIDRIREYMIESNQRLLPVLQKDHLIGVISETDLLHALHDHIMRLYPFQSSLELLAEEQLRNIDHLIRERLPEKILSILYIAGELADKLKVSAYIVGGFVRDLLLRVDNLDIDIVIEGNAILFAEYMAGRIGGRLKAHRRFGTAVVIFPNGFKIDVATARTEYYEKPVALPSIELSSLKHDLYRRDFTINTLALQLNPGKFGQLIDFFGGRRDLKDKKIRVLHSLSFIEDPTRVFRAIRFEQRYGFKIGKNTLSLLNHAVKMDLLTKLQGYRLFGEIYLILQEEDPLRAIDRMGKLDLLKFIHPKVHDDEQLHRLLSEIKRVMDWYHLLYLENIPLKRWILYLVGLMDRLNLEEFLETCRKFKISQKYWQALTQVKSKPQIILKNLAFLPKAKPSQIYKSLHLFSLETLLFTMAKSTDEENKKAVSHYLTSMRGVKIFSTGDDLKSMGYQPGPGFKKILETLLEAKLDGEIKTKQDEVDYVTKNFRLKNFRLT